MDEIFLDILNNVFNGDIKEFELTIKRFKLQTDINKIDSQISFIRDEISREKISLIDSLIQERQMKQDELSFLLNI